jgi:hypothetical protein
MNLYQCLRGCHQLPTMVIWRDMEALSAIHAGSTKFVDAGLSSATRDFFVGYTASNAINTPNSSRTRTSLQRSKYGVRRRRNKEHGDRADPTSESHFRLQSVVSQIFSPRYCYNYYNDTEDSIFNLSNVESLQSLPSTRTAKLDPMSPPTSSENQINTNRDQSAFWEQPTGYGLIKV